MKADVDPLPFVPAMWIGRNFLKSEGYKVLDSGKRITAPYYGLRYAQKRSVCSSDEQKDQNRLDGEIQMGVAHLIANSLGKVDHFRN
jgi:hypothetical protein